MNYQRILERQRNAALTFYSNNSDRRIRDLGLRWELPREKREVRVRFPNTSFGVCVWLSLDFNEQEWVIAYRYFSLEGEIRPVNCPYWGGRPLLRHKDEEHVILEILQLHYLLNPSDVLPENETHEKNKSE